jgi:uncharacterized membrane protein
MLTPFQWSVISFLLIQAIALVVALGRFFVWVITEIKLLNNDLKENTERDKEIKQDYKELLKRIGDMAQGIVRVEAEVKGVQNQVDKL